MQSLNQCPDHFAFLHQLICSPCIQRHIFLIRQFQCLCELIQHMRFAGFFGMQFQTKRSKSDVLEPTLNNFQRRHFLGKKQYRFSLIKGIGNHIGNRLRFTGSGRSMHHKAFSPGGCFNSSQLRAICADRCHQLVRSNFPVKLCPAHKNMLRFPQQMTIHQTAHQWLRCKLITMVMQILPQHILSKGKDADHGSLFHIPALFQFYCFPHCLKQSLIRCFSFIIHRHRIQMRQIDAIFLFEHLKQCNIHLPLIIPDSQCIIRIRTPTLKGHRNQYQWCITVRRFIFLTPFQKTNRQIQNICAAFFHKGMGLTI